MTDVAKAERTFRPRTIKVVGVVGLGGVGKTLAVRLAGEATAIGVEKLLAFDADKAVFADFEQDGVAKAKSLAHLVDAVDLVHLCLTGDTEVGRAARSHEGLLDCIHQGQMVIDHGWTSLALTRQLATAFARRGAAFLDAPIGRSAEAREKLAGGRAGLAVAGEALAIEPALPVLRLLAGEVTPVGSAGSAQLVRQMSDLVALQTFSAFAEALTAARSVGVDGGRLLDALGKADRSGDDLLRGGMAGLAGHRQGGSAKGPSIAEAGQRLEEAIRVAGDKGVTLGVAGSTLGLIRAAVEGGRGGETLGTLFEARAPDDSARGRREQRDRDQQAVRAAGSAS